MENIEHEPKNLDATNANAIEQRLVVFFGTTDTPSLA
jgi:hypothetical protein